MDGTEVSIFSWLYHTAEHPDENGNVLIGANILRKLLEDHENMRKQLDAGTSTLGADIFLRDAKMLNQSSVKIYATALQVFSTYLWEQWLISFDFAGAMENASAWQCIKAEHIAGFAEWMKRMGYARSTTEYRCSIIKRYAKLAHEAGVISHDCMQQIKDVCVASTDNQLL